MDWYIWLFIITFGLFLIQVVLNLIGIDWDLDFDSDGLFEWDIGDFITFKGLLHFLIGFSGSLWSLAHGGLHWYSYVIAIFIGILFMFVLYKLYNWISHLDHIPSKLNVNNLVGKQGKIETVIDGTRGRISVLLKTNLGMKLVTGNISIDDNEGPPHIGDEVIVKSVSDTDHTVYFTHLTTIYLI